jgi:defect-in-organelle-trafficking protein DotC
MNLKTLLSGLFLSLLVAGCATNREDLSNVDTTNLSQLENVSVTISHTAPSSSALSALRAKSLQDSSMSIGAQGGLAWAASEINVHLNRDSKNLDAIYNFNALVLAHGVMPPVLEAGDFSLNLDDPNTIRVADRTYRIVEQARFATTPPNWREYLLLPYSKPSLPDRTLLPKSDEEREVWRAGIQSGWGKGIEQASSIFQQNLARLKRDYRGMLLYRKLLEQNMISPPFVARTEMGVTGDGTDMRVNDQVLRIVALPKLQTNSRGWNAVVVKRDE